MKSAIAALREDDPALLESALRRDPALARRPQLALEAARLARLDALKLLVKEGADLNASYRGYRPLHALIQERPRGETLPSRERMMCLDWLLAHGADPEQPGAWPPARAIIVAAFMGSAPIVEKLRAAGARVDFIAACALGDPGAVKRALAADRRSGLANARDAGGLTPLQCAVGSRLGRDDPRVQERLLEIARLLLDAGADPNALTRSWRHDVDAAYFAVGARNAEALEILLARGADPTAALPSAAWSGSEELAAIPLRYGASLNEARADGRPLLNELVRWGQVSPALWLLGRGADPNLPDARGWTAVHQAASRGNERMFRAVLAAGGDLHREDGEGLEPLDVVNARSRKKLLAVARSASAPAPGPHGPRSAV